MQHQAEEFTAALRHAQMSGAPILVPIRPDSATEDIAVPSRLLPDVPIHNVVESPSMENPFASSVLAQLRESKAATDDQETEWLQESKAYAGKRHQAKEEAAKKTEQYFKKDVIAARGSLDRLITTVTAKIKDFKKDVDKTIDSVEKSTLPKKVEVVAEINASSILADILCETTTKELKRLRDALDDDGLTADDLKTIRADGPGVNSVFLDGNGDYKTTKFLIETHKKSLSSHMKKLEKEAKLPANVAMPGSDVPAGGKAMLEIESGAGELQNADGKAEFFDPRQVHEVHFGVLVERTAASTFFRNQRKFLMDYFEKNKGTTTQSVAIAVKVVLTDVGKAFGDDLHKNLTDIPDEVTRAKKFDPKSWKSAFSRKLTCNHNHMHTGVQSFAIGECIVGLEGSFIMVGVKLGKLSGHMKDQCAHLRSLKAADLAKVIDFKFSFSSVEPKKNVGTVFVIPPGYICMTWSKFSMTLCWGFGSCGRHRTDAVHTLDSLFEGWPQLKSGEYLQLREFLAQA
jgi:hypothetical protein